MNDDQMDELLIEGARDYNKPGAAPREEMWSAIVATRRATRRTPHRVWMSPSIGIAAAALLTVGIGIGRRLERTTPASTVAVSPVAAKPTPDTTKAKTDSVIEALHRETTKTNETVRRLAQLPQSPSRPVDQSTSRPVAQSRRVVESPAESDSRSRALAYRLAVLRHLAGSEALITAFRASARSGEMDAQIAQWSRELLGTTRLLEASAAADDPVMKRLFEDLDLVIAQIAQYSARGTYNPEELDLIEQSIKQRGVISKLRSTSAPSPTAHM